MRARALLASGRAALQQLSTGSIHTSTERLPVALAAAAATSLGEVSRGSLQPWQAHSRGLSALPQLAESAEVQLPSYGGGAPEQPWPREEAAQPPRRRRPLPSVDEVAERLRSHKGASCSSGSSSSSSSSSSAGGGGSAASLQPETLPWREVVAALQASQQGPVTGAQMLTDTFGRKHTYLRISLTERCNLRCLYCMPEDGVDLTPGGNLLTNEEVLRLAGLFAGAGVEKIRLTGGEPTLRRDLPELIRALAALPGVKDVGLTTNGLVLNRMLPQLRDAGLTLLNVSLDTLRAERFVAMTRRQGHDRVLASIHQAAALGFDPVKVNVVVMRGVNDDEVADFVELTRGHPINVRFIEYMPFDGNVWSDSKLVSYRELLQAVQARYGALHRLADPAGEVAKNFRVQGFAGSVSFVTSMTRAFCGDCNRLRVMADGALKVCLFGAGEVSLRDAMREGAGDEDLRAIVSAAVDRKQAAHAGMFEIAASRNRAMVRIGG